MGGLNRRRAWRRSVPRLVRVISGRQHYTVDAEAPIANRWRKGGYGRWGWREVPTSRLRDLPATTSFGRPLMRPWRTNFGGRMFAKREREGATTRAEFVRESKRGRVFESWFGAPLHPACALLSSQLCRGLALQPDDLRDLFENAEIAVFGVASGGCCKKRPTNQGWVPESPGAAHASRKAGVGRACPHRVLAPI